jgi:hypothetical protein
MSNFSSSPDSVRLMVERTDNAAVVFDENSSANSLQISPPPSRSSMRCAIFECRAHFGRYVHELETYYWLFKISREAVATAFSGNDHLK